MVVDAAGRLAGIVTDGDVRRGLLRGVSLDGPVTDVMNAQPATAPAGIARDEALALMQRRRLRHLPVVEADGRLVDVLLLDDLLRPAPLPNAAVLMAGGFGTRLRPLTDNVPKPLLSVGGKPLLEILVERLRTAGVQEIFFTVHYKSEMVEAHFGNGARLGVRIRYVREEVPLGHRRRPRAAARAAHRAVLPRQRRHPHQVRFPRDARLPPAAPGRSHRGDGAAHGGGALRRAGGGGRAAQHHQREAAPGLPDQQRRLRRRAGGAVPDPARPAVRRARADPAPQEGAGARSWPSRSASTGSTSAVSPTSRRPTATWRRGCSSDHGRCRRTGLRRPDAHRRAGPAGPRRARRRQVAARAALPFARGGRISSSPGSRRGWPSGSARAFTSRTSCRPVRWTSPSSACPRRSTPQTMRPQLENLKLAARHVAERGRPDTLVVVRSTVPVGASRGIVLPELAARWPAPRLAFAPERTIQGQALRELEELPQVVGGLDAVSANGGGRAVLAADPARGAGVVARGGRAGQARQQLPHGSDLRLRQRGGAARPAVRSRSARGDPLRQRRVPAAGSRAARLRGRRLPVQGSLHPAVGGGRDGLHAVPRSAPRVA